jgi:hypothetical protein
MKLKNKILIFLIILAIFDTVIPIPFTTIFLIYVLSELPPWFKKMLDEVYLN